MTESVRVACLLDRYWDPAEKAYAGVEKAEHCWRSPRRAPRKTPAG